VTSYIMLLALVARDVPWSRGVGTVHWRNISARILIMLHSFVHCVWQDRRVLYPSPWPCLLSSSLPSPKISLLGLCLCMPVPVTLYGCRSMGMYHVCAHLSWILWAWWPSFMLCIFLAKQWI
jgi:hypothetical protein